MQLEHLPKVAKPRLEGIQICRGVAALLVLLFHVTQLSQEKLGQAFLANLFTFGSAGVDFFFVLSGFIIFFVHQTDIGRRDRLKPFILKRLIRVYPLYWLVTLAILPVYFLAPQFGYGYERQLDVILKSLWLLPQAHLPILIVGWSLSHEVLFYFIFALAILFPLKLFSRLLSGWLVGTLAIFLLNIAGAFDPEQHFLLWFIFSPHNLEFMLGCLAAYVVLQKQLKASNTFLLLLGTACFVAFGVAQTERSFPFNPIVIYGISSTLIVIGAATLEVQRSRPFVRLFSFLGDASYSIYLTHYPCLSALLKLTIAAQLISIIGYSATISLLLLTTLSVGCLTYVWLEKPLVYRLRGTLVNQLATATKASDPVTATASKVLFLDQSGALGGAELCLLDLVQPYRDRSLVCLFADGAFKTALQQQGVAVKVVATKSIAVRKESGLVQGLQSLGQLLPIAVTVARLSRDYDVIYANTQKALVVGALASLLSRRPLVYHLHDILSADHFSRTNRRLAVTLANRCASRVIATSNATRDAFIQAGGHAELVTVVYNGFEPAAYQLDVTLGQVNLNQRQQLGLDGKFAIGHFSRLSPWKGQHILIEALVHCPKDVIAVLVGDALFGEQEYVQALKTQVTTLGLQDRVQFLGFRSDVVPIMQACEVIAHTSTAPEPFGRVIVEAMLCGRPIIAAAAGGAVELVEPGVTGWLTPPGDAQALAAAIAHCRADPAHTQAIVQTAQTQATDRFALSHIRQQIDQLLQAVVKAEG
ncbi:glycosyltransferase [Leptolyngbya sp. FACHB-321]|uniref:glycosyltransferase n=1 Tax=Leptolyngbya sp. FACHB-321 TaxID=2692807 RepID=UPI001687CA7F|nr:glycosyltransferase [Leptolyngbya sp. FACHB-321]MBD2036618.1 glycosyltransferase [Leptolyngbya sp. FACHB-321]